jgi:hypothetical protein
MFTFIFKIRKIFVLFSFLLGFINICNCQCITLNLIKNPSLEEYTCCPNNAGMINCSKYWSQPWPDHSTSEYLNICGIDSLLGPDLLPYYQNSYFGNGYAGIVTFSYSRDFTTPIDYREYIQGGLSQPLIEGQCYFCEFWVKLFTYNSSSLFPMSAIDALSILFTDTLPQKVYPIDAMTILQHAQIMNQTGRIITDTANWTMISDTFIAKGGEKYFTVGSFKQPEEVHEIFYGSPKRSEAYYFYDNFSLCPCEDTISSDTVKPPPQIFEVYPNPAKDDLFVLYKGYEAQHTLDLSIYNILGELVLKEEIVSSNIPTGVNITQISAGCYVLVIKSASKTFYKDRLVIIR